MVPRCETCRWYRPGERGHTGTCRYAPPVAIQRDGADGPWLDGQWPTIWPHDVCAEWADPDEDLEIDDPPPGRSWLTPLATGIAGIILARRRR